MSASDQVVGMVSRGVGGAACGARSPGAVPTTWYPDLKFNWKKIRAAIQEHLDVLPDRYEYRSQRLRARFRDDLCAFTRHLILADPQDLESAAHVIQEHRHEREYLADLIAWRLKLQDHRPSEWNSDNAFYWRFAFLGRDVPPDTEEHGGRPV